MCIYTCVPALSQKIPVVQAGGATADVRDGEELSKGSWNINPSLRPDVYETYIEGKSKRVTFITDRDSISFDVMPGQSYPFVVLRNGKDSAFTEIKGIKFVPRAKFSKSYQQSHRGKTFIEVPEVYELINIVFALTENGRKIDGLIARDNDYYREAVNWFTPYMDESAVKKMNAQLEGGPDSYSPLKMDAYAFKFGTDGTIIQSPVYDRIGRAYNNHLRPYIGDLQKFAKDSRFQKFYHDHKPFYDQLIRTYRDSVGVPEMQRWLIENFPTARQDCFKIIFSPLVSGYQSASSFDEDGFREAQAHANPPYLRANAGTKRSPEARRIIAGNILFTELNHSFIGPEGDKPEYSARIEKALSNLATWNDPQKPARYYDTPRSSFEEYMNWALVSLRYVDYAPKHEQDKLIAENEEMMVNYRGFRQFAEFDQFLVKTYKARRKGETAADLYPLIVGWFKAHR